MSFGRREATVLVSGNILPQTMMDEEREPSVLENFDAERVLDALGFGIIVLDEQLCAIYANVIAQHRLAVRLREIRGRPLVDFLPRPQGFALAVRCVLESGATLDYTLRVGLQRSHENMDSFDVRIVPLRNQTMGMYALIEWMARPCVRS